MHLRPPSMGVSRPCDGEIDVLILFLRRLWAVERNSVPIEVPVQLGYSWSTMLNGVAPFFIVDDLSATIAFYQGKLGFDVPYKGGGDAECDDFWAFLARDRVMLMFKAIASDVHPQPNRSRHEWARWDAYINTDDPDGLYAEFVSKGVPMHRELANTSDGLRAFEIADNNGYVLCFGRPINE